MAIYEVPVRVSGLQLHRVRADDPEAAAGLLALADHDVLQTLPIRDLRILEILEPCPVPVSDVPDHDTLVRHGRMLGARPGCQEFDYFGRGYRATWMTQPGRPCWVVEAVTSFEAA